MTEQWSDNQILTDMAVTLVEILAELKKLNSTDRTGAVSSVEIHDLAPTKDRPNPEPQCSTKVYAGSVPPVEEAIEAHARLKTLATARALDGWRETVEMLTNGADHA